MPEKPSLSYPTILAHAKAILLAGTCLEVRVLRRGTPLVGFFNDPVKLADFICNADNEGVTGFYYMNGPVHEDFLARIDNHFETPLKNNPVSATDGDVLWRTSIVFDIDPERKSGISATDEEHERALLKAHDIAVTMEEWYGWPKPAIIDSGNGAHVKWAIRLENTAENTALVQACLQRAKSMFDDDYTKIDGSVFNASRIFRFPGTAARKGEHRADRPWRLCHVLDPGDGFLTLTRDQVVSFTGAALPAPQTPSPGSDGAPGTQAPDGRFRSLNSRALAALDQWVPALFPLAERSAQGWEITGEKLNRGYEERISFHPKGIKDFGPWDMGDPRLGKRTPVEIVAEHHHCSHDDAAKILVGQLGGSVSGMGAIIQPPEGAPNVAALQGDLNALMGVQNGFALDQAHIDMLLLSLAERHTDDLPPSIYDGWLHVGISTTFAALPKTGKSTLMQQIAICGLMGVPLFRTMMPCRRQLDWVLIYAFEDHQSHVKVKMNLQYRAICREHGIEYTEDSYNKFLSRMAVIMPNTPEYRRAVIDGIMPDLRREDWIDTVDDLVNTLKQRFGPTGLIIIDTFEKMTGHLNGMSGNPVETDQMKVNLLIKKAATLKVAIGVTHHQTKMAGRNLGGNAESFMAGTYGITAESDNYITMTKPNDDERQKGQMDVKVDLNGRMLDVTGSWGELPTIISFSPKVKSVEDGGYIFRARPKMPDDPNAMDDDQALVYGVFLSKLDQYFNVNKLVALTGLSDRRVKRAVVVLVEKGKIIDLPFNAQQTAYCIEHSAGYDALMVRIGMSTGATPSFKLPNVL